MENRLLQKVKNRFVYNVKALAYWPFSLMRNTNICMWHTGRCGSTVIADLIKQDGRIDWAEEILESFSKMPPPEILEKGDFRHQIFHRINKRQKLAALRPFGFEMKIWHYKRFNLDFDEAYEIIKRIGFSKHIILERKNYLRVGVSAKVAATTGQSHLKSGQERKTHKVTIDVSDNRLYEGIKLHEDFYRELKQKLPKDSLYICYEDDVERDPSVGYKKVMQYAGFTPKDIKTSLRKTNPQKLSEIIENYDAVCNNLKETPYHWMVNT